MHWIRKQNRSRKINKINSTFLYSVSLCISKVYFLNKDGIFTLVQFLKVVVYRINRSIETNI